MSTEQNNTGDRLAASELEQLRARVEYLEARLAKAGEERDALAAHGERLHDSVIAVLDTTIVWSPEHFELKRRLIDKPAISLTRRDALKQAEALDQAAMDIRADYGHHTQYSVSLLACGIEGYANGYRRQVETADVFDAMGYTAEALVREIEGTQDKGPRS
ncbi:MAG: hypothetical protein ACQEUG_15850 [Pseudomonadota bacterium]